MEDWQPSDERFVLHIFANSVSTPDELSIAVYLAHKLSDTDIKKLKTIAESDSPQAHFAREALQRIEHSTSNSTRSGQK